MEIKARNEKDFQKLQDKKDAENAKLKEKEDKEKRVKEKARAAVHKIAVDH